MKVNDNNEEKSLFDELNGSESNEGKVVNDYDESKEVIEEENKGSSLFANVEKAFEGFMDFEYKNRDTVPISVVATKTFVDYAGSVILGRSIPDLRDGLKPSQRRILHAMKGLSISHSGGHKKSARIVGECIGKYHPHGDNSVYDTMVNMSQDWKNNQTFVDGQGNWGSIDGDNPAAMRYTEARFEKFGSLMFKDIDKDLVDYNKNYDGSEFEPEVLPAPFPNILINGVAQGSIAVGMATSLLPHNPTEVMNALDLIVENRIAKKETTAEEILALIPAPDFPTGGIVYNTSSMLDIIKTGKGSVRLRAKHSVEDLKRGKSALVFTEIPFMKKKSALIDEIVNLKKLKKEDKVLQGITNIRDESSKEGMRIVIDVKSGWDPEVVCSSLMKNTGLDVSLAYFSIVIDSIKKSNGQEGFAPREYGLLKILERYTDFKMELIIRKWNFILKKTNERLHILEGLLKALDSIDEIIAVIKKSRKFETALKNLVKEFGFSEIQATSVLNMRLSKLTGLEKSTLLAEEKDLKAIIKEATKVLGNESYRNDIMRKEFQEMAEIIKKDRKTEIKNELNSINIEHLIPKEDCIIYTTHKGYVKRVPAKEINRQNRGTKGKKGIELTDSDFVEKIFETNSHATLLFVMNNGQVYGSKAYNVPDTNRGSFIENIFELKNGEKIVDVVTTEELSEDKNLIMVTSEGYIKKTKLSEYTGALRKVGVNGINLKKGFVISTSIATGTEDIIIATKNAKSIKFNLEEVSLTGRSTQGVYGIKLKEQDQVIGSAIISDNDNTAIATISELGQAKVSWAKDFKTQSRAGVGVICMQLSKKSGELNSIISWQTSEEKDLVSITEQGIVNRVDIKTIKPTNRSTKGVKLITLKDTDKVVNTIKVDQFKEEEEGEE